MRIAIIGYGRMAQEYKRVVEYLGHTICCFMKREEIIKLDITDTIPVVYDYNDLLGYNPDAVIIAVSQEETEDVLISLLSYKQLPILAEKSVILNSPLTFNSPDIKVGYNRRFYKGVVELNAKLNKGNSELKSVYVNLPEPIEKYKNNGVKLLGEYPLHYSASHVIDLLFYLLGRITIQDMYRGKDCYVGLLMVEYLNVPILFKSVFNAPEHTEMTFNFEDEIWTFCPIEKLHIYDKLVNIYDKLVKSSNDYYRIIKKEIIEDNTFKAGLVDEVRQFLYFNKEDNLATLDDALKVSNLCNEIIGSME